MPILHHSKRHKMCKHLYQRGSNFRVLTPQENNCLFWGQKMSDEGMNQSKPPLTTGFSNHSHKALHHGIKTCYIILIQFSNLKEYQIKNTVLKNFKQKSFEIHIVI